MADVGKVSFRYTLSRGMLGGPFEEGGGGLLQILVATLTQPSITRTKASQPT